MSLSEIITIKRVKGLGWLKLSFSQKLYLQPNKVYKRGELISLSTTAKKKYSQQQGVRRSDLNFKSLKNLLLSKYLWFLASQYLHTNYIYRLKGHWSIEIGIHNLNRRGKREINSLGRGSKYQFTRPIDSAPKSQHNSIHWRTQLKW